MDDDEWEEKKKLMRTRSMKGAVGGRWGAEGESDAGRQAGRWVV